MAFDEEKYRQVFDIVKNMKIDYETFELFDISYVVLGVPSRNDDGTVNGEPGDFSAHETGEWAIYVWEDLEEKIQKPILFHDIVDIYHMAAMGMDRAHSHNTTMPWEKRFCEEYLTPSELENYLKFKKEHGYNGFDLSDRL